MIYKVRWACFVTDYSSLCLRWCVRSGPPLVRHGQLKEKEKKKMANASHPKCDVSVATSIL